MTETYTREQLIEMFDEVVDFELKYGILDSSGKKLKKGVVREITGKDQIAASNDNRVRSGNKVIEGFIYMTRVAYIEVDDNTYRPITFDEAAELKNSDINIILKAMMTLAEEADFFFKEE
jgi:hypothetical protein